MFKDCTNLKYLNLYSFKINNDTNKDYIFNEVNSNLKYCINDITTKNY